MKNIKLLTSGILLVVLLSSCEKDKIEARNYARLKTTSVKLIDNGNFKFSAEIISAGNSEIKDHGFIWSTFADAPIWEADRVSLGSFSGTGSFYAFSTSTFDNSEKYYVRSYLISTKDTVYGNFIEFYPGQSNEPEFEAIIPEYNHIGDTIEIKGSYFTAMEQRIKVYIDNKEAKVVSSNESSIKCIVPFGISTLNPDIRCNILRQDYSIDLPFHIYSPEIHYFYPVSPTLNDTVCIAGNHFGSSSAYANLTVLGTIPEFISWTNDTIKLIPPAITTPSPFVLSIAGASIVSSESLSITGPLLTGFDPALAVFGEIVTIAGEYLPVDTVGVRVLFGNVVAEIISASENSYMVYVPNGLNQGVSTISINKGEISVQCPGVFTLEDPVVSSISGNSGSSGEHIIVTGSGFSPDPEVTKVYFNDNIEAAIISSGFDEIIFEIPFNLTTGIYKISMEIIDYSTYLTQDFEFISPWQIRAPFPGQKRDDPVFLSVDGKIYYGLGTYKVVHSRYYPVDFWCYDPGTDLWTRLSDFPGAGRYRVTAFSINGYIYAGLGYNGSVLNDFWKYNPSTGSWEQLNDGPSIDFIYRAPLLTYQDEGYKITVSTRNIWYHKYSSGTDSWSSFYKRYNNMEPHAGSLGGYTSGSDFVLSFQYSGDNYITTHQTPGGAINLISMAPSIARYNYSIFESAGDIYYGGGFRSSVLKDFYKYSRSSDQWSRITDIPGGDYPSLLTTRINDRIFIIKSSQLYEFNPAVLK